MEFFAAYASSQPAQVVLINSSALHSAWKKDYNESKALISLCSDSTEWYTFRWTWNSKQKYYSWLWNGSIVFFFFFFFFLVDWLKMDKCINSKKGSRLWVFSTAIHPIKYVKRPPPTRKEAYQQQHTTAFIFHIYLTNCKSQNRMPLPNFTIATSLLKTITLGLTVAVTLSMMLHTQPTFAKKKKKKKKRNPHAGNRLFWG